MLGNLYVTYQHILHRMCVQDTSRKMGFIKYKCSTPFLHNSLSCGIHQSKTTVKGLIHLWIIS